MPHTHETTRDRESNSQPELQARLIRLREVMTRTGLSRSAVYAAMKTGSFPAPIPILPGGRSTAWVEAEVDLWLKQRISTARLHIL